MIVILLPAVTARSNCVSESSRWVWCVYEYQSHIKNLDNGTHKVKPILISASRPVPRYSFSLSSSTPSGELSGLQCVSVFVGSSILIEEDYLRGNRCFGSGDWNSPLKELFSFSSFLAHSSRSPNTHRSLSPSGYSSLYTSWNTVHIVPCWNDNIDMLKCFSSGKSTCKWLSILSCDEKVFIIEKNL